MTDLISRQAAIDILNAEHEGYLTAEQERTLERVTIAISELPSAEPERKKGKWIKWNGMDIPENHGRHKCSQCGEFAPIVYEKPLKKERLTNFCPNCGSHNGDNEDA